MRSVLVLTVGLSMLGAPASAATVTNGPVTVSVTDATWTSYNCQTTQATLTVTVPEYKGWIATMQASPDGKTMLNAALFADIGSNVMTKDLLICPLDSNGGWTAKVTVRRLLEPNLELVVPFTVSKVRSTTTITSAVWRNKVLRVRGSAIAANGMAGRASLSVERLRNGTWRSLGHTNANSNGVFKFLAPRKADQVRVTYLGDLVTVSSSAQSAVTVVRPKR